MYLCNKSLNEGHKLYTNIILHQRFDSYMQKLVLQKEMYCPTYILFEATKHPLFLKMLKGNNEVKLSNISLQCNTYHYIMLF